MIYLESKWLCLTFFGINAAFIFHEYLDNLFTGSNSFYQPVPDAIKPLRFSPKPDNRPASLLSTPTSKPVYTIVANQPLQTSSNQKIQIDSSFVQTASLLVGDGKGFSEKLWIYIYLFQLVVVVFRVFCCNHTQWGRNRWEPELRYSPKFENRTNFYAIFSNIWEKFFKLLS